MRVRVFASAWCTGRDEYMENEINAFLTALPPNSVRQINSNVIERDGKTKAFVLLWYEQQSSETMKEAGSIVGHTVDFNED